MKLKEGSHVIIKGETCQILEFDRYQPNLCKVVALTEGAQPFYVTDDQFETLNKGLNKMGLKARER
jgi:hypothetical protein